MSHTLTTQAGSSAIAATPASILDLPAAPAQPHLNNGTNGQHAAQNSSDEEDEDLVFRNLPPFPTDVPTAPLLRLSLVKLLDRDQEEEARLWKACTELGFFYLDLRPVPSASEDERKRDSAHVSLAGTNCIDGAGLLHDAEHLFELGEKVFSIPVEEKQKYDMNDQRSYFGYKGLGQGIVDAKGTRDANEFWNVSKDDVLSVSAPLPAPEVLQRRENRELLGRFCERSHAIVSLILEILERGLEAQEGTLRNSHRLRAVSGDQVRWVHAPPRERAMDGKEMTLGEHTDFGSVTVLFNRLGGLQILPPDGGRGAVWQYVKPLKGHAVVNLGDALVKFTAGVLRSNLHRVVDPPGEQRGRTRMSLVYFARPEDEVVLKKLDVGVSRVVDEKWERDGGGQEEEVTAKEWILRRAMGRRAGGDWEGSKGTEGARGARR